ARGVFRAAVAIVFSCCLHAGGQTPDSAPPATPNLTGIAHVAIRVADLERARSFFHQLGFEEAFAMDQGGKPTEAFFKINDRQFIELYPRRDASSAVGFMHVCFEAADLNAVHQDYVSHGLSPNQVRKAGAGNLLFTLQGPDQPGPPSDLRGAATQNIEYTQYMPGSRHTLDRGQHLGPNRIADRIAGVGIPFADPAAAETFYIDKLSFERSDRSLVPGYPTLALPSSPGQQIEFLPATVATPSALPFDIIFSVPNLRSTQKRLNSLGIAAMRHQKAVTIQDPDGDSIVFVEAHE
ncbi:MAG TPA: VOC family protein, partial [Acidobacteriaceae bacterium]|nr:VOC family protein [Acidobacteriaceae bacterium]